MVSDAWLKAKQTLLDKKWSGVFVFVVAWFLLGLLCAVLVSRGHGEWIELLNGATWPNSFSVACGLSGDPDRHGFLFLMVVALRTLLNLGVLFTAMTAAYWLLTGRLKRSIMDQFAFRYRTNNVTLANALLQLLEDRNVKVPDEVEREAKAMARHFGLGDGDGALAERVKNAAKAS